jgi:hypothetical protein
LSLNVIFGQRGLEPKIQNHCSSLAANVMSAFRRLTNWISRGNEMTPSESTAAMIWPAGDDGRGRTRWDPRNNVLMMIGATKGVRILCSQSLTSDAENWVSETVTSPDFGNAIRARSRSIKWACPEAYRTPDAASTHWSITTSGRGSDGGLLSGSPDGGFLCT